MDEYHSPEIYIRQLVRMFFLPDHFHIFTIENRLLKKIDFKRENFSLYVLTDLWFYLYLIADQFLRKYLQDYENKIYASI